MSTGLYLPNGQLTEVCLCEAAACAGLKVRLGPHHCLLSFSSSSLLFRQSAGGHRPTHVKGEAAKLQGAKGSDTQQNENATRYQ